MTVCNFDGANLFGADLSGSRFRGVDFSQANLSGNTVDGVDFSMATLRYKKFAKTKLSGVNFTEADLSGADFAGTEFTDCHLNSAVFNEETVFDGADLRGATISSSQLAVASLKGAIVSAAQAHTLLFEAYGIVVAEDAESFTKPR
jgi:uncharacterized protein YjbI with pentapeptide repeats